MTKKEKRILFRIIRCTSCLTATVFYYSNFGGSMFSSIIFPIVVWALIEYWIYCKFEKNDNTEE